MLLEDHNNEMSVCLFCSILSYLLSPRYLQKGLQNCQHEASKHPECTTCCREKMQGEKPLSLFSNFTQIYDSAREALDQENLVAII